MTEPRELVPAFSVDLEPTEAGANRGAHELTAFAAEHGVSATGAAGPLEAFGLATLQAGCAEAGLSREA